MSKYLCKKTLVRSGTHERCFTRGRIYEKVDDHTYLDDNGHRHLVIPYWRGEFISDKTINKK